MTTETIPAFYKSFQETTDYAKQAARQLARGGHVYTEAEVQVIEPARRDVTLGTRDTCTNFVMTPLETVPSIGWYLETKQSDETEECKWFCLSRTGKVAVVWEGDSLFATQLTVRTFTTALMLLTDREMSDIAAELKKIARK